MFLQEASELSSLKPQLDQLGVPLYAVVKEDIGTEIQDFRPHFAGDVFLDEKVRNPVVHSSFIHTSKFYVFFVFSGNKNCRWEKKKN